MLTASLHSIDRFAAGLGLLPDVPALRPGTPLGRFALLRRLGTGTTGAVFGAYDPDLDREVALKVVAHDVDAYVEARTLARLSHPNVVSLFDAGECDGAMFLAMELVRGESLRRTIGRRRTDAVVDAFVQLARGLHAVHQAGFVHRDVKPDNVLVGDDGRVRLVDFGLAHRQGTRAPAAGTPAYMAPELFDGALPDPRSDQFAFAVSLWEVLTGARPFEGRSILQLQQRMRAGLPRAAWRTVPATLRPALRRALEPRPERRFPSMKAVEDALVRAASPRPARATGGAR